MGHYDPAGFVTVDKPALGFWLQTLSAAAFGYTGWALILPQALAAFGSVGLLYFTMRRRFGIPAALVGALALAVTPIFIAAGRNNTIDSTLTFIFVFVTWTFIRAVETGQVRYLYLSFVALGLGFNVKMMEAALVVPGFYLAYFLAARSPWGKRVLHLALGTLVFASVALSWSTVVDLTPPKDRPFVGSTRMNSEWELILGHNGFDRLGFNHRGDGGRFDDRPRPEGLELPPGQGPENGLGQRPNQASNPAMVREFGFNSSKPGPLRFFTPGGLSYQSAWVLLFSGLSAAAFFLARPPKKDRVSDDNRSPLVLFWALWLGTEFLYFSFTGGMFHTYYLTTLAPAAAALAGVGFGLWGRGIPGWKRAILPGALVLNSVVQTFFLAFESSDPWQIPLVILVGVSTLGALVLPLMGTTFWKNLGAALTLTALFSAPLAWSTAPLVHPMNGSNPTASWSQAEDRRESSFPAGNYDRLADFLEKNQGGASYALAVPSSRGVADDLIIQWGLEVIPLGGFMGSDTVLTLPEFQSLVHEGKIPFALVPQAGNRAPRGRPGPSGTQEILAWVRDHGKIIPRGQWTDTVPPPVQPPTSTGPGQRWAVGDFFQETATQDLYDLRAP